MAKIYRVRLEATERKCLEAIIKKKRCAAHRQRRARILLKADENSPRGSLTDVEIASAVEVGTATVERVRRIFVMHGMGAALERKDPDRT
jgi:hypothetical protein